MLLKIELPEQEHGSHEEFNFLEIDSDATVIASVVGVEKSEYHTRYHLGIQRLICTNYPDNFEFIILKQSNSMKTWKLVVEFKSVDPDEDPDEREELFETHELTVSGVKEVSSYWDI